MFEHFKEMFGKLLSAIIINQMDSEETKAKKIIWYSCIGAVIILIIVSWFILLISTFSNEKIKVPMLAGDDIYAALTKLSEKKLSSHVIAKYSDIIEPYKVIKSDPIQGSIVKSKRLITIYVSLGARDVSLPDFTGYNLFELGLRLLGVPSGNAIGDRFEG